MNHSYFFYGTLRHLPLLAEVLGRAAEGRPAELADHAVLGAEGHAFPVIAARPGAVAEGILVEGVSAEEAARLEYYEAGFSSAAHPVAVAGGGGTVVAQVFLPAPGLVEGGTPWHLADWAPRWGAVATEAARVYMAGLGTVPPETQIARYPGMLTRASDRLRALSEPAPANLRRPPDPEDVTLLSRTVPWASFFSVEEITIRHRRFDGTTSGPVLRELFISPDAATVLPYDAVRDRVLVVEQFRPGPYARGDRAAWQVEAVAGLIDAGESPEEAARREAEEEARVTLSALYEIGRYYPSPGARTEYLYSYLGLAELPDEAAGIGGVEEEAEDIRSHVIGFDRAMELLASGEISNAPLMISLMWLARERGRLRAEAGL